MDQLKQNRLKFLVGLNTGYVTNGIPDARYIDFYQRRSSPELHCAIVGNVVVPGGFASNDSTPVLSGDPVWRDVAACISDRGSVPGIQLATAWDGYVGSRKFRSPTASRTIEQSREVVRALGLKGAKSVLSSLNEASEIAVRAGFRHVQVHAAHGYLFSLLVDNRISHHSDEIKYDLTQFAKRLSKDGIETSIRISLKTGDQGFDEEGAEAFTGEIARLPFDFVDLSSGFYNIDKQLIYPSRPDVLYNRRLDTVRLAKRFPRTQFIYSGRALLRDPVDLPKNIHIGLCRDLIANPRYLENNENGCINSGKCHYFSRGASNITCSQWPNRSDH